MLEAHDSEVLCLEYTRPQTGKRNKPNATKEPHSAAEIRAVEN